MGVFFRLFTFFKVIELQSSEIGGAYHLARKSGNFGLKSNGKVIFRKFHSEIAQFRIVWSGKPGNYFRASGRGSGE